MIKVSLIIPVYNAAPFLRRCFDSVARQLNPECQVIVIDDGSTDGGAAICDQYKDSGFEVYHMKNSGVSRARNYGMSKAKGKYIAFLDSDDALENDALRDFCDFTKGDHNIIQFNQSRYIYGPDALPAQRIIPAGDYGLERTPKYWVMVWNKLFKRSFLKEHKIKFVDGMQFGEDEMFSVECILKSRKIRHESEILVRHYFDNKTSLCRGELDLERLKGLDRALHYRMEQAQAEGDEEGAAWLARVIKRHHRSKTFREYGFREEPTGKYDIIYFLKNDPVNEELRYSLRSVEKNWEYRDVWFYGGCPTALRPDHHVPANQSAASKFERVRDMMRLACQNNEITEDFWLFNDDFFVLQPVTQKMVPQYNGNLYERIVRIEERHGQAATIYTKRLRHLVKTLKKAHKGCLNYAVHKPMLINRAKMLEVLDRFPDEPMLRALYGNYWEIGGENRHDMKIELVDYDRMDMVDWSWEFVSTSDISFESGVVGRYLRTKFNERSRFEK